MKAMLQLLAIIYPIISFSQSENQIKKHSIEINYQRHYSFRKIWWLYTDRSQNNYFGYAYTSPEDISKREKEDSPVYSQSVGINLNYSPRKWLLLQFGSATGSKGYGSETFITPKNEYPFPYVFERTSYSKPVPLVELTYSLGPQIYFLNDRLNIFASVGHSVHFVFSRNLDHFNFKGIYAVKSKKGFSHSDVVSENSGITPFMTICNLGVNYYLGSFSIGIKGTYEWNAKRYEGKNSYGKIEGLYRTYIYTYGISMGYCW